MQLKVHLPSPILVTPSFIGLNKQVTFEAPPTYDAASLSSQSSSPLSLVCSTLSCSSSSSSSSLSSSSSPTILKALVTLTVPSTQKHTHVLTSLTVNLKAYDSLAHNNGGFEQSHPVDLRFSIPLPSQYVLLQPGEMYTFPVELPCPDQLPPSVQLPDARLRYKLCVRARTLPASCRHTSLGSWRRSKKLRDSCVLTVMQAVDTGADEEHSNLNRVWIDGLGSLCISTTRSVCSIGGSTFCHLSLPDDPTKINEITKIDLSLRQDSYIHSRPSKSAAKQHKPRLLVKLHSDSQSATVTSAKMALTSHDSYQAEFHIPQSPDLQPSTLSSSNSVIHVSHHLCVDIDYLDSCN